MKGEGGGSSAIEVARKRRTSLYGKVTCELHASSLDEGNNKMTRFLYLRALIVVLAPAPGKEQNNFPTPPHGLSSST